MQNPDAFRDRAGRGITRLRALASEVGIHREDLEECLGKLESELQHDLSELRPLVHTTWMLGLPFMHDRLVQVKAPPIILINHARSMRQMPVWIQRYPRGHFAWTHEDCQRFGEFSRLVFFEPEPTVVPVDGGLHVRHAPWDDGDGDEPDEAVVQVTPAFLDLLDKTPDLWRQQRRILAGWSNWRCHAFDLAGGWDAYERMQPSDLRAVKTPHGWMGMRETPFLLGRLAHLLRTHPPVMPAPNPSFRLEVERAGRTATVTGWDRKGEGTPVLYCYPAAERDLAEELVALLFSSTRVADTRFQGSEDTCGHVYWLGVHDGRLLAELIELETAPWRIMGE